MSDCAFFNKLLGFFARNQHPFVLSELVQDVPDGKVQIFTLKQPAELHNVGGKRYEIEERMRIEYERLAELEPERRIRTPHTLA